MRLSRRRLLALGGLTLAGAAAPRPARAATPKPGGVFRFRGYTPPHFDPHLPGGKADASVTMSRLDFMADPILPAEADFPQVPG